MRERVNNSFGFAHRHKILFGLIVAIGVFLYVSFNAWMYQYSRGDNVPTSRTNSDSSPVIPAEAGIQRVITPLATPTPLLGPGVYACDEYGICNIYEDAKRAPCPKTYADKHCLYECQKKEVRCPK